MPTARKHPGRPKGSGTIGGERFTVLLPTLLMARLDAYCQGTQAGLAPRSRAEIVRVALEHYLSGPSGPDDAESGSVLTVGQALSPMGQDKSLPTAAPRQDHERTPGRTGRKRTSAKG